MYLDIEKYKVHLELCASQNERYNYDEYLRLCTSNSIEPISIREFALVYGTALISLLTYHDVPLIEGCIKLQSNAEVPAKRVFEKDRGLGDTIANITKATGLDKLSEMYTKITGKPCGCSSRQEVLNKLVPYGAAKDE